MGGRRSLVGVVGAVLPTLGGACCVGLGAGGAIVGGALGAALAWVTPLLAGLAFLVLGLLLLRVQSPRPWRRWHGLVAVAASSYLVSALVVVPVISGLLPAGGQGSGVLP